MTGPRVCTQPEAVVTYPEDPQATLMGLSREVFLALCAGKPAPLEHTKTVERYVDFAFDLAKAYLDRLDQEMK